MAGVLVAGCGQETTNIDVMHDDGKAVMALDYRDFDQAASKMVQQSPQQKEQLRSKKKEHQPPHPGVVTTLKTTKQRRGILPIAGTI